MMARLFRTLFTAEALGYLLVFSAVQIFIYGVASSLRSPDSPVFFWASFIGVLAGLGLGKSRSRPIQTVVGVVAVGLAGLWLVGGRLLLPLLTLGREVVALIPQWLAGYRDETLVIQTGPVTTAWAVVVEASVGLWARFQVWTLGFESNVRVNDALVRNLLWLFAMWLIAAWMGWFTARRNALLTLAPSLVVLALVTSYSAFRVTTLWAQVVVLLLLMGVWNYRNQISRWEQGRVDFSESISYDNTQAVLGLVLVIAVVAFVTPSISWRQVRDFIRERQKPASNQVADALGLQQSADAPESTYKVVDPTLPREYLLLGGAANSERVVMTVRTGELPPIVNAELTSKPPRYYWRSVVYDRYAGTGWVTGTSSDQSLPPNSPLIPGLLKQYRPVTFNVQMEQPQGRFFWSGVLYSADVPLTVKWRLRPTSDLFADQTALLQADIFAVPSPVDRYRASAYVSNASTAQLRAATTDYPTAIRERYLALPLSVPPRVLDLARQITQGLTNPYDQAKAIESYLRANYPYDLEVSAPPRDVDVADYFLFELKRGYCDYYATAMVVLARANNLPARFVSGYSPGEYDAPNARYIVRELHAHSWAEVYFPGYGWIEFEPTASLPEIERVDSQAEQAAGESEAPVTPPALIRWRIERIGLWLSPLLVFGLLPLVYFAAFEKWLHARLAPARAIERVYRHLYRTGRPLAGAHADGETPAEFAAKLTEAVNTTQARAFVQRPYRGLTANIEMLTQLYNTSLFRDVSLQANDFESAWRLWTRIRWRLWWTRVSAWLAQRRRRLQRKTSRHTDTPQP